MTVPLWVPRRPPPQGARSENAQRTRPTSNALPAAQPQPGERDRKSLERPLPAKMDETLHGPVITVEGGEVPGL
jgi:hypothetical protein